MGHDERRPVLHEPPQRGVDLLLHLDVDGTGGVVEDEDRGIDEERTGDGDALTLPARERVAALADHRVVPFGELPDEDVGAGGLGGGDDLFAAGVGSPVGDVVPNGDREEERLVEDDADVAPQAGQGQVPDVLIVDEDGSVAHVVEAGESRAMVDLPLPVRPTRATVSPGRMCRLNSDSTSGFPPSSTERATRLCVP